MNADAIRHLYGYHFAENRALWDNYVIGLSQEQFTLGSNYSIGSVRNQLVHLMNVDDIWFSPLWGKEIPDWYDFDAYSDRAILRAKWDAIEQKMREYLAALTDDMLTTRPYEGEDENLILWQVLMQVVNHGTDHRAQILRLLYDMGIKTVSQDYIFYVYDHP